MLCIEENKLPVFLEGNAVILSPMRKEDAYQYMLWMNDKEVAETLHIHLPVTLDKQMEFLEKALVVPANEAIHTGIWTKNPLRLIGNCSLMSIDNRNQNCNIGIFIGEKSLWGKGYGSEALKLLLRYAFDTINMRKVILNVYSHNERALKCYEKLGFKLAGTLKENKYIAGAWRDEIIMEIFKEDF